MQSVGDAIKSAIPVVVCPVCGNNMRLSVIEPDVPQHERMTFTCDCGFNYRQSHTVGSERAGNRT